MRTETKQIFSIPPNPKPRKKRVDYEINNYCPLVASNTQKMSYGVQIAIIESEQQVGIAVRKEIRKGFNFTH
jgi:hypothetical protein